ncbi:MAG: hypothetical protein GTN64_01200 [Candidatus Latescibacteria bacterium]|nr:hypothetical protein [Candidatus Latescibacterota bacterium]NIO77234.1 hypothetical protein [Candidatus Latescibacterota bacterium]
MSPNLSSSFGEYREGHLHAGIDIRTFGKEGVPCRAVDDGYISRVRTSPHAYGKALYIGLQSGETAVYAHLSEFSPSIESFAYHQQRRLGSYEIDIMVEPPERFPVKRGEIIGYTGSTGAGAPHLHFEIRDSGEHPMNPLSQGWVLEDSIYPRINRIVWIPLGKDSQIDGWAFPREIGCQRLGRDKFVSQDTVTIQGRLGLAARIVDRTDASSGRLLPYRIELYVDGELVSRIVMERFSFPQSREVDLVFEMERALSLGEYYLTLFERPGESVWNRDFHGGGAIDAEDLHRGAEGSRLHEATIQVTDHNGQTSILSAPFYSGAGRIRQPKVARASKGNRIGELPGVFILDDLLSVREGALSSDALSQLQTAVGVREPHTKPSSRGADGAQVVLTCEDLNTSVVALPFAPVFGTRTLHIVPLSDTRVRVLNFPDLGVTLGVPIRPLYGDGFIYLTRWEVSDVSPASAEELESRSQILRLGPLSLAIRTFIGISFGLSEPADGSEAVYRWDGTKGEWTFMPSLAIGDSMSVHARQPGLYAVFSDRTPPRIMPPTIRKHQMYGDGKIFPEIVIELFDDGSSLNPYETAVLLDGEKQIAQWDSFSKKMLVLLREKNIIGYRELRIDAVDRAGNESHLRTKLRITEDHFSKHPKRSGSHAE